MEPPATVGDVDKGDIQVPRKIFGEEIAGAMFGLAYAAMCAIVSCLGTGFLLDGNLPHDLGLVEFLALRIFVGLLGTVVVMGAFMLVLILAVWRPNPQKVGTAG